MNKIRIIARNQIRSSGIVIAKFSESWAIKTADGEWMVEVPGLPGVYLKADENDLSYQFPDGHTGGQIED